MNLTKFVAIAGCMGFSQASWWKFDKCPEITPQQNFDVQRYLGRWFPAQVSNDLYYDNGECNTADYEDLGNGYFSVNNSNQKWINPDARGGPFERMRNSGTGYGIVQNEGEGLLGIKF